MSPAEKAQANAQAIAACFGIVAVPSRDERGRHTLILTKGPWTREIVPEQLADALAEARALQLAEAA